MHYIVNATTGAKFMLIKRDSCDPIISSMVVPALPAGLYFNESDGTVSGIATETQHHKYYKFTVSNSGGASTFYHKLSVQRNPPRPYQYVANAAARAWKECTITEDRELSIRYGTVKDTVATCEQEKDTTHRSVSNLTTYYDALRTDWQQKSRELAWSLSNVTVKNANLATLSTQLATAEQLIQTSTSNYSATVAQLTRQTAAMEEADNLKITVQPSSALNVMNTIEATVVVRAKNGTLVTGLHGFVHTKLHGVANSEISAAKFVDGVANVQYQVQTPGTYQLEISSAGFSQSLHDRAQVCNPASRQTTVWTGYEIDGGIQRNLTLNPTIETDRTITGSGTTNGTAYTLSGNYRGNKMTIIKTSGSGNTSTTVTYHGAVKLEDAGTVVMLEGTYNDGTGSSAGGFHLSETSAQMSSLVGTCALTTISSQFSVGTGPASKIIFGQQPPTSATHQSTDSFSVTAQLADAKGNILSGTASTAFLTIEGGDKSLLTADALNTTFASGTATFTGIRTGAGKNLRMLISTAEGQYNVSSKFKAIVTPASFTHTLTGMTEEVWNNTDVQEAFRETIAYHMGDTVEAEDVTITGYTVTTRRSSGINVNHNVALTNSSQAANAVSGLENATNSGALSNTLQSNAAKRGKDLSGVSSGSMSGTSSSDVANTVAAQNAAAASGASSASSSSSSSEKKWEITAIVFMAACGISLVAIAVFSVFSYRKKPSSSPGLKHASTIGGGMTATEMDTMNCEDLDDDINEKDDAICQQDAPTPAWKSPTQGQDTADDGAYGEALEAANEIDDVRDRADSSATVHVDLSHASQLDNANTIDEISGQI